MKVDGIKVTGPIIGRDREILTPDALRFAANLAREFETRRQELLHARDIRQAEFNRGVLPNFLPETEDIRESNWKVAPIVPDLEKRHVEITGPVDRKMMINALNSGADVFMADFEDSLAPTWRNVVEGQVNLKDAVNYNLTFDAPGKHYELEDKIATLMVRPRGWHLNEDHVTVDGKPISAALFDFGLYFYHNAEQLLKNGSGPYFYLPKVESHHETKLWDDIFRFAQNDLGIPDGSVRATVLIETILAAFEMDEILYSLKDHSAGLNAGRWDYLFSIIKKFRNNPKFVLPDRSELTMDKPPLDPYADLLVRTAHRRGIHGIGGMAAHTPNHPHAREEIVRDATLEVQRGHDGKWASHPKIVPIIKEVFEKELEGKPHQIDNPGSGKKITQKKLLKIPKGKITEAGLRTNIRASILYLAPWVNGIGCSAIDNKMEDAATVEISRSEVWQWLEHKKKLDDGRPITINLVKEIINEELEKIRASMKSEGFTASKYELAAKLFESIVSNREYSEFLTLETYPHIQTHGEAHELDVETKEAFVQRTEKEWRESPRWKGIKRNYSAEEVYKLKGLTTRSLTLAKNGARKLWNLVNSEDGVRVLSAITGNQAIQEVAAGLKAIYLSGWQVAADNNDCMHMYPDQSLYGPGSMPRLVKIINNALAKEELIFHQEGNHSIDWMVPLVADGESGFGGPLQTFELMKNMILAGAAGVHLEDQLASAKKCGHMGGKVLVPTSEFVTKLSAARLAADVLGAETILIARTDANSGGLLTSDVDDYDKPFIDYSKGRTEEGFFHVKAGIDQAIARGLAYAPYVDMIWCETSTPDIDEARAFAKGIHEKFPGKLLAYNCSPSFNWLLNFMIKAIESYAIRDYTIDSNVKEALKITAQMVIEKGNDVDFEEFKHSNKQVEAHVKLLGSKLKSGPDVIDYVISHANEKIASFQDELNKMGYKFQFITLSGFHVLNLATFKLARDFKERGMLAYSELQQDEFANEKHGYLAAKHQKFVGTGYYDEVTQVASGGSASTVALKGSTEEAQFH